MQSLHPFRLHLICATPASTHQPDERGSLQTGTRILCDVGSGWGENGVLRGMVTGCKVEEERGGGECFFFFFCVSGSQETLFVKPVLFSFNVLPIPNPVSRLPIIIFQVFFFSNKLCLIIRFSLRKILGERGGQHLGFKIAAMPLKGDWEGWLQRSQFAGGFFS